MNTSQVGLKGVIGLSIILAGVLVFAGTVLADRPDFNGDELNLPNGTTLVLPEQAHAGDVVPLGTAVDPVTGKTVEGFAFFHHRDGHNGGPRAGGGGGGDTQCFAFLGRGVRWNTVEDWVFNPSNRRGLDATTLFNLEAASLEKWEDATDGVVDGNTGTEIFGTGTQTSDVLVAETDAPDGVNEVYFADISTEGAIGVTIVWGVFSGPPFNREIVEWDQVYDDVDFDWSVSGEAGKMDFDNIATHENGHSAGFGHPDDSCTEETMYRFASEGETKKRDLNAGDVSGAAELY